MVDGNKHPGELVGEKDQPEFSSHAILHVRESWQSLPFAQIWANEIQAGFCFRKTIHRTASHLDFDHFDGISNEMWR